MQCDRTVKFLCEYVLLYDRTVEFVKVDELVFFFYCYWGGRGRGYFGSCIHSLSCRCILIIMVLV